jgi:hypothetical protein
MATKNSTTYVIATTTLHGPGDLTVTEGTIRPTDDPDRQGTPGDVPTRGRRRRLIDGK